MRGKIIQEDVNEIIRNLKDIKFEDQTILVTGGAGFLGSWMCDVLVEQNAQVICLDNLASGLESNVYHLMNRENFKFVKHGISQPVKFDCKKIDVVMHFASRASPLEFEKYPVETG